MSQETRGLSSSRSGISPRFQLEVCIESLHSALAAETGGASRLELCSALSEGGLTPSAGLIGMVRERTGIALHILIRPRSGDFCYSDDEFQLMKREIRIAKELGADGVVFGILDRDGSIDRERNLQLVELAHPLGITFHRAFDLTCDPHQSLEDIISLGIPRLLTSGQAPTAFEGRGLLAKLARQAAGRISLMPGGGISESNITAIVTETGVHECHASARRQVDSVMRYRRKGVAMGASSGDEYSNQVTDAARVEAMLKAARS